MNKWTERLVLVVVALILGLAIGWGVRGVATYSPSTETVTAFGDWRTACPPAAVAAQKCQVVEEILDTRTNQPVVRITMFAQANNKQAMDVMLPLGVALEAGAGLVLGTDPVRVFPYRTCTQGGCLAELVLDDKALASFSAAKDGKILIAGLDGKPVAIPMSLKGYADANRAYHSAEQRRASWFWRLFS